MMTTIKVTTGIIGSKMLTARVVVRDAANAARVAWRLGAVAAFAAGIMGCATRAESVTHAESAKPPYTIVPFGSARFEPLDPTNPDGPYKIAHLSGDPKTGPMAFMLSYPKGPSPIHWHSSDYYGLTVTGNTKHWLPGKEADATSNPPGTFWFQPGGGPAGAHGDECLSDRCTLFVYMPGKYDFTVVSDKGAPGQ